MTRTANPMTLTDDIKVVVLHDDNRTQAEVVVKRPLGWASIGLGEARRRPGDRRDIDLGEMLALARAFKDAHNQLTGLIHDMYPNGA